jgi:uroporphyrin-III C-methyltransferase
VDHAGRPSEHFLDSKGREPLAENLIEPGEVWLVGAGPGNPDLLTRKAERLIGAATVIFYDALVGSDILDLIPDDVARVFVGKRSGRHAKPQQLINELLFEAALGGARVVRLKGGDPAIFARTGEEIEYLAGRGVTVRICPGITAASAAAASAGVSLTMRGSARKITFLTAQVQPGTPLQLDWGALADPETTLAIYMGKAAAPAIAQELLRAGAAADTPVLIVENVSLVSERIFPTRLDLLRVAVPAIAGEGPMVLLIGRPIAPRSAPSAENKSIADAPAPALTRREHLANA